MKAHEVSDKKHMLLGLIPSAMTMTNFASAYKYLGQKLFNVI